jgi:predicted  nucleic acid-binding Zn-ribbon protein
LIIVVTAAVQDQWRLLDVQAHDNKLHQLAHREHTLTEHAQVAALESRLSTVSAELVVARTAAEDLRREVNKAEADVEQVRQRLTRNQSRLDAGQGPAKELQAMQHELESLRGRIAVLEDAELEVMERQEAADAALLAASAEHDQVTADLTTAKEALDKQLASIHADITTEQQARESAAAGIPESLLVLYEKVRGQHHGVGAARLYQGRCEGCNMQMTMADMGKIKSAPMDEVLRCEECMRILVRTPDSGL